jgi:hypothetical protein
VLEIASLDVENGGGGALTSSCFDLDAVEDRNDDVDDIMAAPAVANTFPFANR